MLFRSETGLSILQVEENAEVDAVLGKSNFININPKKTVRSLVLCIDNDGTNTYKYSKNEQTNTIIKAAERLNNYGFNVQIMIPEKDNTDLNDVLIKEGKEELKKQLNRRMTIEEFKEKCDLVNKEMEQKRISNNDKIPSLVKQYKRDLQGEKELTRINYELTKGIRERIYPNEVIEINNRNTFNKTDLNREMEREL